MLLLGNTFPTALIRRRVIIEPHPVADLASRLQQEPHLSFWGHENTRALASAILGVDITRSRVGLALDSDHLPSLASQSFTEVFILSPNYAPGFRPTLGMEVTPEEITGWQVLLINFY
jgi:hypothetical protein